MIDVTKYFQRIDTSKLAPFFLEKCKLLISNCVENRGNSYYALSGFRSPEDQEKIYNQGRTTPGEIVSNAAPYKSYHNYGLAIDFCFDSLPLEGLQPSWDIKYYQILDEEAKKIGLMSGAKFPKADWPHIQVPLNAVGIKKLEEIYKSKGLQACWDYALTNLKNSSDTRKLYI